MDVNRGKRYYIAMIDELNGFKFLSRVMTSEIRYLSYSCKYNGQNYKQIICDAIKQNESESHKNIFSFLYIYA